MGRGRESGWNCRGWVTFGAMVVAGGVFGPAYRGLIWRDPVQDGVITSIDLADRIWYEAVPVVGYLIEAQAAVALVTRLNLGGAALALSVGTFTVAGIHNAWDVTVWYGTRRRE